ncbi:MAG: hypothetical protein Q7I99_00975, partial [Acholeplasmataceae bacterium]|nr:hypothetical protein [Acholeplasmataceae bacterium]
MKKILVTFLFVFLCLGIKVNSIYAADEVITYPFDQITIVEAFHFNVSVDTLPSEDSILFGLVEVNDIINVYIGILEFADDAGTNFFGEQIMIIKVDE